VLGHIAALVGPALVSHPPRQAGILVKGVGDVGVAVDALVLEQLFDARVPRQLVRGLEHRRLRWLLLWLRLWIRLLLVRRRFFCSLIGRIWTVWTCPGNHSGIRFIVGYSNK
jgi:hypothetical protein